MRHAAVALFACMLFPAFAAGQSTAPPQALAAAPAIKVGDRAPGFSAAQAYGVLNETSGVARRSTFGIAPRGIVQHVDVDKAALDPNAAIGACERVSKR